jgi:hypothetical protein
MIKNLAFGISLLSILSVNEPALANSSKVLASLAYRTNILSTRFPWKTHSKWYFNNAWSLRGFCLSAIPSFPAIQALPQIKKSLTSKKQGQKPVFPTPYYVSDSFGRSGKRSFFDSIFVIQPQCVSQVSTLLELLDQLTAVALQNGLVTRLHITHDHDIYIRFLNQDESLSSLYSSLGRHVANLSTYDKILQIADHKELYKKTQIDEEFSSWLKSNSMKEWNSDCANHQSSIHPYSNHFDIEQVIRLLAEKNDAHHSIIRIVSVQGYFIIEYLVNDSDSHSISASLICLSNIRNDNKNEEGNEENEDNEKRETEEGVTPNADQLTQSEEKIF